MGCSSRAAVVGVERATPGHPAQTKYRSGSRGGGAGPTRRNCLRRREPSVGLEPTPPSFPLFASHLTCWLGRSWLSKLPDFGCPVEGNLVPRPVRVDGREYR